MDCGCCVLIDVFCEGDSRCLKGECSSNRVWMCYSWSTQCVCTSKDIGSGNGRVEDFSCHASLYDTLFRVKREKEEQQDDLHSSH